MEDVLAVRVMKHGTEVTVRGEVDLDALRGTNGVGSVWIDGCKRTADLLRSVAGLPDLVALSISWARADAAQFRLVAPPPLEAATHLDLVQEDEPARAAFRKRRSDQAARLVPRARAEASAQYAPGIVRVNGRSYDRDGRQVQLFAFIATSLRVGPRAIAEEGEEVDLKADELRRCRSRAISPC